MSERDVLLDRLFGRIRDDRTAELEMGQCAGFRRPWLR